MRKGMEEYVMKKLNKFMSVAMSAAMVMSLAACGSTTEESAAPADTATETKTETKTELKQKQQQRILIRYIRLVFYSSWSIRLWMQPVKVLRQP